MMPSRSNSIGIQTHYSLLIAQYPLPNTRYPIPSIMNIPKTLFVIFFLALFSCKSTTKSKQLQIAFSSDSSAVCLTGMSELSLAYLKNNLQTDSSYQNLVSVVQVANDDEENGKEVVLP